MSSPATILVEMSGRESCEKEKGGVTDALRGYFADLKDGVCQDAGMKTNLVLQSKVLTVASANTLRDKRYLVALIATSTPGKIAVKADIDASSFRTLNAYLQEKYWAKIEVKDFHLRFLVVNDYADKIDVKVRSAYLDGKAFPFEGNTSVARREKASVLVSAIFVQKLLDSGSDEVFAVSGINPATDTKVKEEPVVPSHLD